MHSSVFYSYTSSVFFPCCGALRRLTFLPCAYTCDGTRRIIAFFMADMASERWEAASWLVGECDPTSALRRWPV